MTLIDRSIACIENFSNELFYEVFDYLDGCEIYHAFVSLNRRFRRLLDSPSLQLKFQFDSQSNRLFTSLYELLMDYNQHQIFSIHLSTSNEDIGLITLCSINSSFTRLESLTIGTMESDVFTSLLLNLTCLPRLFSLSINGWNGSKELNDIYFLIFNLPKLRFVKFSANSYKHRNVTVSLPTTTSKSFSPIEHLVIDHPCTSEDLSAIISHTPHLSRLSVTHALNIKPNFPIISPVTISNLTDLSIHLSSTSFDQCEILISKICPKLKVLRLDIISDDKDYLHARRWEQFILQYLPGLEAFYLKYFDFLDDGLQFPRYSDRANQFFSSFWIERQWILETDADTEMIVHSVRPYKEKWFDYPRNTAIRASDQLSTSMHLLLHIPDVEENLDYLCEIIYDIINVAQIYHLTIHQDVCAHLLGRILTPLCKLDSLQIASLSLSEPRSSSCDENSVLRTISSTNRIATVNLQTMNDIEEVYFLIELCPYLVYLKVDLMDDKDVELFVRLILIKMKSQLRLLCFYVPTVDDQTIKTLKKMIDDEKLLIVYSIKRKLDFICLQWERKELE